MTCSRREAAKKLFIFNGRAIKTEGEEEGVKSRPLRKKNFLSFFQLKTFPMVIRSMADCKALIKIIKLFLCGFPNDVLVGGGYCYQIYPSSSRTIIMYISDTTSLVGECALTSDTCPKFGILELRTEYRVCRFMMQACYENIIS